MKKASDRDREISIKSGETFKYENYATPSHVGCPYCNSTDYERVDSVTRLNTWCLSCRRHYHRDYACAFLKW